MSLNDADWSWVREARGSPVWFPCSSCTPLTSPSPRCPGAALQKDPSHTIYCELQGLCHGLSDLDSWTKYTSQRFPSIRLHLAHSQLQPNSLWPQVLSSRLRFNSALFSCSIEFPLRFIWVCSMLQCVNITFFQLKQPTPGLAPRSAHSFLPPAFSKGSTEDALRDHLRKFRTELSVTCNFPFSRSPLPCTSSCSVTVRSNQITQITLQFHWQEKHFTRTKQSVSECDIALVVLAS